MINSCSSQVLNAATGTAGSAKHACCSDSDAPTRRNTTVIARPCSKLAASSTSHCGMYACLWIINEATVLCVQKGSADGRSYSKQLFCMMRSCAVLCYAVLCCALLCYAVLCCAVLCCAMLCYAMYAEWQLHMAGETVSKHETCIMSSSAKLYMLCMQKGNYTWQKLPAWMESNISRSSPATSLTVFPRIDVPYRHYLRAINNSCSVIKAPSLTTVSNCSRTAPLGYGAGMGESTTGYGDACCYNSTDYTVRAEYLEKERSDAVPLSVNMPRCHNWRYQALK